MKSYKYKLAVHHSISKSKISKCKLRLRYVLPLLLFTNLSWAQSSLNSEDAIPDSTIASASGKGIVAAMFSCGTSRYAHAVLGDAIEAGCLVVEDDSGENYVIELPESQVFEDLIPRIADIDGNGINDVVVVRSDAQGGAALAIYTVDNKAAVELAATPPIGRAFRWLAPVGIADFNGDDQLDVAYVQTPHIGGILKVWTMTDNGFEQIAELRGFSNHSIGSNRVSTAKLVDHNKDGVMDMALPNQRRSKTIFVTLSPELSVIDEQAYQQAYFD